MSKMILDDASFVCGASSTDLSDHVRSVTINLKTDIVDGTCMGDDYKVKLPSFTDWSMTVEFAQDYASGNVDSVLFPLIGTTVPVKVRPVNTSIGVNNPEYNGSAIMTAYTPLDGKVSELNTNKVTFDGTGTLSRSTT
jgi:hypothetical protein